MTDDLLGVGAAKALDGLIRVGTVAEVLTDGRVRCTFPDRDDVSSPPMPVLHRRRGDLEMPSVDDPVLCLMLPPDQVDGFVLSGFYDSKQAPPTTDPAPRVIYSDDLRLGAVTAAHKVALGDVLLRILVGLRELLASVQVATPAGPGQLTGVTTNYGSGTFAVVAAALDADIQDAVLLSQTIRVEG